MDRDTRRRIASWCTGVLLAVWLAGTALLAFAEIDSPPVAVGVWLICGVMPPTAVAGWLAEPGGRS